MPHKNFEEEKFLKKAAELKGRFQLDSSNTLFLPDD